MLCRGSEGEDLGARNVIDIKIKPFFVGKRKGLFEKGITEFASRQGFWGR